jgi:phosphatidate cytidylyltransferase
MIGIGIAAVAISAAFLILLPPGAIRNAVLALYTLGAFAALASLMRNRTPGVPKSLLIRVSESLLYPAGFLLLAPLLRAAPQGFAWVVLLVAITFATDTAAFFVGRAFGRRKLAPSISPSKTWEGAIGGVAGALIAGQVCHLFLNYSVGIFGILLLSAFAAVAGQLGDLAESRVKRTAGVKDSGVIMPGHGGILDRLDSIVFNLAVVYYFVLWQT